MNRQNLPKMFPFTALFFLVFLLQIGTQSSTALAQSTDVDWLAHVGVIQSNRMKTGFIDTKGQWVIQPQFDSGDIFSNGLVAVKVGEKWGYIHVSGQWVAQPLFDLAGRFTENGLAAVKVGEKWGCINATGQWVIEPQLDHPWCFPFGPNGLAAIQVDGKWGYVVDA